MYEQLAVKLAEQEHPGVRMLDNWRKAAVCRDPGRVNPNHFFSMVEREQRRARAACEACPARASCLKTALAMSFNPVGIWGGLTYWERNRLISGVLRGRCHACGEPIVDTTGRQAQYCEACRTPSQRPAQKDTWTR